MKQLFLLCSAVSCVAFAQPGQPVVGTISGILKGEDGSVIGGAAIYLHLTPPSVSRIPPPETSWTAATTTAGTFQVTGLPSGTYTLCPRAANTTWLSPCDWSLPTPMATISSAAPYASTTITLKRGAAVPIRIDDASRLLSQNQGKTAGADLLLGVSSPTLLFRIVPLVSQDASGGNYQIVVPFNTPLTLVILPSLYHVNDAVGSALTAGVSTKIPLLIPTGQQAALVKFSITGIGGAH